MDNSREGTKAFKRNPDGSIKATKTGNEFPSGHPGAKGQYFKLQEYELELQDGSKIKAYQSLGQYDPITGSTTADHQMDTDCHGVTFTEGNYWINNDQVETVLKGGGFQQTKTPHVGDVGVYYDSNNNIVHSVTVTKVDSNGNVTEVTGLGGLEMKEHSDPPKNGWYDHNATIGYYNHP